MANPFTSKTADPIYNPAPADWLAQQREIEYQRMLADKLESRAENPLQGQMVSGHYVAPSWSQQLATALSPAAANLRRQRAAEMEGKLSGQIADERTKTMQRYAEALRGRPESVEQLPQDVMGPPQITPAQPGDKNSAIAVLLGAKDPMLRQIGMQQQMKEMEPQKPVVVGRTLMDQAGKVIGVDSTWQADQQAAREQRKAELEARLADQRTSREEAAALRRELAANASADRRMIAGMVNARQEQKNVPKLPTSALKMQQEELDAIGTAGTINADLKAFSDQIEKGELKLGPVANLIAKGKNIVGASDESSRNLASFQATLERLRNDSLRLNKGVQTEGDAQRAWNELITNINDPKVVKQRLAEVQKINERAANLRKMNVDAIRSNFGVEPMDTGERLNQQPAVGGGATPKIDDLLKKYGG